jgi:hypothetical protein
VVGVIAVLPAFLPAIVALGAEPANLLRELRAARHFAHCEGADNQRNPFTHVTPVLDPARSRDQSVRRHHLHSHALLGRATTESGVGIAPQFRQGRSIEDDAG